MNLFNKSFLSLFIRQFAMVGLKGELNWNEFWLSHLLNYAYLVGNSSANNE